MKMDQELDAFARQVMKEAKSGTLDQKLEALKLLTAYYVGVTKVRKGEPTQPDPDTFQALKNDIGKAGEYDA